MGILFPSFADPQLEKDFLSDQALERIHSFILYERILEILFIVRIFGAIISFAETPSYSASVIVGLALFLVPNHWMLTTAKKDLKILSDTNLGVLGVKEKNGLCSFEASMRIPKKYRMKWIWFCWVCFVNIGVFYIYFIRNISNEFEKGFSINMLSGFMLLLSLYLFRIMRHSFVSLMGFFLLYYVSVDHKSMIQLLTCTIRNIVMTVVFVFCCYKFESDQRSNFLLRQRLKEKQKFLEGFIKSIPDPVIIYSKKGIYFQNQAASGGYFAFTNENFQEKAMNILDEDGNSLLEYIYFNIHYMEECKLKSREIDFAKLHTSDKGIPQLFLFILVESLLQINRQIGFDYNFSKDNSVRKLLGVVISDIEFDKENGIAIFLKDVTEKMELQKVSILDKYKNIIMYSMSHELRTPLNGIVEILSILKKRLDKDQLPFIMGCVSLSKILLSKINDILDYAQIMSGEFTLRFSKTSIQKLALSMKKLYALEMSHAKEFKIIVDQRLPEHISIDCERLKQVLINLLDNAFKYTNKGFIILSLKQENNKIKIKVKDTGTGMSNAQVRKLFKLKSSQNKERKSGLAGLGLTISKLIVQKMGGQFDVKSKLGKGSVFSFEIPLIASRGLNSSHSNSSNNFDEFNSNSLSEFDENNEEGQLFDFFNHAGGSIDHFRNDTIPKEHVDEIMPIDTIHFKNVFEEPKEELPVIVIVDDNNVNRSFLSLLIAKYNARLLEGKDGFEAIQIVDTQLRKFPPKILVFMDLDMPHCDGIQATTEIRAMEESYNYTSTIIACTAYTSQQERNRCQACGMNGFLTKPISDKKLRQILRKNGFTEKSKFSNEVKE